MSIQPLIKNVTASLNTSSFSTGKEGNVLLTTHSTHFFNAYMMIGHMVKDHSNNEETRNGSMGPPRGIDPTTHHTFSKCSNTELNLIPTF